MVRVCPDKVMTVLAFVCLFLPLSCSVKEDRSRCPFVLTVDLSLAERPQAFCDSVDVYAFDGSSDCFSRVVFSLAEKGACTFELLRGKFNLCGFFNFSSSLGDVSSGRLAIPIGSQADSLYAFAYDIEFSLERMIVYPRLYKQFATMSLVFDGIGEAEQFAANYTVKVTSDTGGIGMATLEGFAGKFEYEPPLADGRASVRLPRQAGSGLRLEVRSIASGDVVLSRPLSEEITASGYDWSAPDLDDIEIAVSGLGQCTVKVNVKEWDIYDIQDINI